MASSSMLTREQRWVPGRKSMTVLGKIAVPKPVNLPSQRLENHGLDPNVEIVPKGTPGWGSRSSSTTTNAWGSSALSPSTPDGGAGSPSFLTGRPSSGGSGTRPSTAGSDKSCDTASNAWGSNSQPSSACGTLTSSQTLVTSTRPRSAETRPSSSHLSRFAESNSDSSSAWSRPGTAEKLGTASAKVDGFTMSSGDFPTLGSGKSSDLHTHRGHSSHGRPLSASGRAAPQSDTLETSQNRDGSADASTEKGNVNTWRRDESPCHGGLAPPSMEKCQSDPQLPQLHHPNLHMPPHHIDPWHGLPILNPPEGAWHRGGHPGVPYGPAFPPGSYSHQHLGYYHSQLPSRPTSNLQAGSNPGVGPGSCQPNSGDAYHPHLPDSYIFPNHPVIPVRPGAYTGPPPNGYYVPPRMNFRSSNEQFQSTEMIAGPRIYKRHSNQNAHPDINKYHARPVRYDPTSTMANEQMPSAHSQDTHRGPYKVLLKQHDAWGEKDATDGQKQDSMLVSSSHSETVRPSGLLVEENDLEGKWKKDEQIGFSKSSVGEDVSFHHTNDQRGRSSVPNAENLPDNIDKAKVLDDGSMKRPETASIPAESPPPFIALNKNATLIDKIERLNTKARNCGWQNEVGAVNVAERNQFKSESVKANCSTNNVDTNVISIEKTLELDASCRDTSMSLKSITSETVNPRPTESQVSVDNMPDSSGVGDKGQFQFHKKVHSLQGRMDYRGKGKFNVQGGEEWRKKSSAADCSVVVTARDADACLDNCVEDRHAFQEVPTKQESKSPSNAEVEYCATRPFDSASYEAKAEMKESAMPQQEGWVKEQKANAPTELGELNRQKVAENPSEKLESNAHQYGREDIRAHVKTPKTDACITKAVGLAAQNIVKIIGESTEVLLSHKASEVPNCAPQGPIISAVLSVPPPQDSNATDYASHRTVSQLHDHVVSRQKHMGHKRKQSNSQTKNLGNMAVTDVGMKVNDAMIADGSAPNGGSSQHDTTSITDDTLLQYKKKNNRSAKNKPRLDDVSLGATVLPSSQPIEGNLAKASSGISKVESPEPVLQPSSIQAETPREIDELGALRPAVEAHGRGSNQGKPHSSSKMSRSAQAIRVMEKLHGNEGVVWAPVRPPNKNGPLEEAGQSAVSDGNHPHSAKNGHEIQSSLRTKRVETERYIPKRRVKEQSEQEKSQQLPTFHSQEMSDEMAGSVECGSQSTKSGAPDSSAVKESFTLETRNVEGKHNRHRTHTSWRRRGSVESPMSLHSSHNGSSVPSDAGKTVQKPVEQDQHLKTDNPIPKGQQKYADSGWNAHERATEDSALADVEDHGTLGKGRLQPYEVHRAAGHKNTAELKIAETGATDKPDTHSTLGFSGLGRSASGNENQGLSEHESYQWGPKSHSFSSLDHQGVGASRGARIQVQVGRTQTPEKEFSSQGMGHFPSQTSKDSSAKSQSQAHRHDSRGGNVAEIANMQQQDSRRERKRPDSSKEHAPNHGPASLAEPATETIDRHQEQQISSGPRQYGHQNARFSRRRETSYRGGQGPASESIRQQPVLNRNGRHQNLHYEYLPVRSAGKLSNVFNHDTAAGEETGQGSRVTGTRYQEQGQNQSRHRGNLYRRNVGGGPNTSVQEASAHDNGE